MCMGASLGCPCILRKFGDAHHTSHPCWPRLNSSLAYILLPTRECAKYCALGAGWRSAYLSPLAVGLAHIILVTLGHHQIASIVGAHIEACYHALCQATRFACAVAGPSKHMQTPQPHDILLLSDITTLSSNARSAPAAKQSANAQVLAYQMAQGCKKSKKINLQHKHAPFS